MSRTARAVKECAEWLVACVRLGWPKAALDDLEAIWWRYHDDRGRLVASQAAVLEGKPTEGAHQ